MEILDKIEVIAGDTIIMSSDNCTAQYKSSQHFNDLKTIANVYKINIIRIYGIPGHGKNEIDAVGGTQKIALWRGVAEGKFILSASSCVDYLNAKFGDSESPEYDIKEIYPEELQRERKQASKINFKSLPGSSKI